jgi:hypothetical protein
MGVSNLPLSFVLMCLYSKMKRKGLGMGYRAIFYLRVYSLKLVVVVLLSRLIRRIFLQVMTGQIIAK